MFGIGLTSEGESEIVRSKCSQYWLLLQNDPYSLESFFQQMEENPFSVPKTACTPDPHTVNSLSLIYSKPKEAFTKDLSYFNKQRRVKKDERKPGQGKRSQKQH